MKRARTLSVGRRWCVVSMALLVGMGMLGAWRSYGDRFDLLVLFVLISVVAALVTVVVVLYDKNAPAHNPHHNGQGNTFLSSLADAKRVSELAHDLKTPLTVMGGYAKLTMRQIETNNLNDQTYDNLHAIFTEAQRLSELVDKLLNPLSHPSAADGGLRTNVVDLMQKVYTMCSLLLEFNNNRLEINASENYPYIRVKADMVIQVFFNLVGNANRHVKSDTVKVHVTHQGDMVAFSVWNNGPLIPPDMIGRIFDRGISGADSTGLGLHICKKNIESFGGTIGVVSNKAEGTKFTFTLPVY